MIQFQLSAPSSISIFGEHANCNLRTSIDLRITLNFQEIFSNNIEINFAQINLFHKISLQEFLQFYNKCVENIELLHVQVTLFTISSDKPRILQIFYYLLVCIMYEEQIEIRKIRINLSTKLTMHEKFFSWASLKVCLAACLLHWTRLHKYVQNTFDDIYLKKVCTYATRCEDVSILDKYDIMVCTYGSMIQYEIERNMYKMLYLPRMMILLVDSKRTPDVKARNKEMTELKSMLPDITNSILNNIDIVTNKTADIFQKMLDNYLDNELTIKMKFDCFSQLYKILENYTRMNQRLLRMLGVSYCRLNQICAMAQKHGLSGKYTDFGNGRYAYVWCPYNVNVTILMDELKTHGFDVMQTNLFCTGVKID